MRKVKLDVIKPWITQQVCKLLGFEDDVVIDFVFNQLEERQVQWKIEYRVSFLEIRDSCTWCEFVFILIVIFRLKPMYWFYMVTL